MPVEIRELVIKTEITSAKPEAAPLQAADLQKLKSQITEECLRVMRQQASRERLER